ncbi:MAG TPA: AAA family ATPase, partial [Candidatus Limnocylindria bacterium]|nr:AAA family ATPase [Candidatus Limnocylindria bacterium]
RLVRELLASSDARVVVGRCLSYGTGVTYWPLAEIVRQIGDVRAALGNAPDADLVAARVDAAIGTAGAATADDIAWGFRRLFETLARERPLIIVLDDIHWAEPTLLDLIEYVATFARDAALTILCTARAELFERRGAWATPRPNALVLTLEPLGGADTAHLVEGLGALRAEQRARIVEAAEGNPLFVEQLVAMQREHGDDALAIPPTLQALLAARIDGLAPQERAVLERGAIEGRLFHRGSVQQLLPEPERPGIGAHLLTLVRKALVRPDQASLPGDDGYRFGHVLIRDAAYDAMPKRQRADLHERFADWLERRLGDAAPPEIVGYHLEQAHRYRGELGEADASLGARAAEQLRRAAVAARLRGDVPATIGFFTRAVEALPAAAAGRPALLLDQGEALHAHAEYAAAKDVLERALREARDSGDAHVEWRARLELATLRTLLEPDAWTAEAVADGRAAIAYAEEHGDNVVAVHAWRFIANHAGYAGRLAEEAAALDQALRHARAHGDRLLEVEVLRWHVPGVLFGETSVEDGLRRTDELRRLIGDVPSAKGFVDHMTAHLLARVGEHDEARRIVTEWREHLRELGQILMHAITSYCAWDVANHAGDWAAGEPPLREAYALLESRGEKGQLCTTAAHLAQSLLRQGRYEEAERFARLSGEIGSRDDVFNELLWRSILAETLAARGAGGDEATALAREAVALADGSGFFEYRGDTRVALAAALGAGPEAARALDEAHDIYARKGNRIMQDRVARLRARSLAP